MMHIRQSGKCTCYPEQIVCTGGSGEGAGGVGGGGKSELEGIGAMSKWAGFNPLYPEWLNLLASRTTVSGQLSRCELGFSSGYVYETALKLLATS